MKLVRIYLDWSGTLEQVRPYLESAHGEGADKDWSMEQILEAIRTERWAAYATVDGDTVTGAGVVCVTNYGLRRVLEIILFGADLNSEQWVETLTELKAVAKSMGCSAIHGRGRPGWARYLRATPIHAFEIEV